MLVYRGSGANPFDPRANSIVMACDYNVAYLKQAMEEHGFGQPLGLLGCNPRYALWLSRSQRARALSTRPMP